MKTTEELADEIAGMHVEWFRKQPKGELVQTCLIYPESGMAIVVPCGWRNADERRLMLAILRAMMVAERAVRYAVWSEVWMQARVLPPGTTQAQAEEVANAEYEFGDISREPDRIEAVYTLVVEASGKTAERLQKIVRGRNGGVRALEPMAAPGEISGALANLLPPRTFN